MSKPLFLALRSSNRSTGVAAALAALAIDAAAPANRPPRTCGRQGRGCGQRRAQRWTPPQKGHLNDRAHGPWELQASPRGGSQRRRARPPRPCVHPVQELIQRIPERPAPKLRCTPLDRRPTWRGGQPPTTCAKGGRGPLVSAAPAKGPRLHVRDSRDKGCGDGPHRDLLRDGHFGQYAGRGFAVGGW
jgi:hypothetical protein